MRHLRRCLRCGRCPLSTGRCQAATLGRPERLPGPPTGPTPRERRRSLPPGPAPKAGLHLFRRRNYSPSTSRLPTLSSPHYGHGVLIAASIPFTAHPLTLIHRSASKGYSPNFAQNGVLGSSCATVRLKSLRVASRISQPSNKPPRS